MKLLFLLSLALLGSIESAKIHANGIGDDYEPTKIPLGDRPPPNQRLFVSPVIDQLIANISSKMRDQDLAAIFTNCLPNTLDTTVHFSFDPALYEFDTFVITGDIEAMWLRDSANQVLPYVPYVVQDPHLKNMIQGVINRQTRSVVYDPYANAFNKGNDGGGWMTDDTWKLGFLDTQVPAMTFKLHERKFEIDSIIAVIKLSYAYYNVTKDTDILTKDHWKRAMFSILDVLTDQQRGSEEPGPTRYFFQRTTSSPTDTLLWGVGPPARRTGMCKSPFRPSDDASLLPFPIAANAMAVVALRQLSEMLTAIGESDQAARAENLARDIDQGIQKFGVNNHLSYGDIYTYEVDGYGNKNHMDDANVPSLLSLPYLGYVAKDDPTYTRTRMFLLSGDNPYFFNGTAGQGIGGPHVGLDMIWPMSIIMRALTSNDDNEILDCLIMLKGATAGTGFMHESFNKNDATSYTRPWFAWANSLFGELILTLAKERPYLIFN